MMIARSFLKFVREISTDNHMKSEKKMFKPSIQAKLSKYVYRNGSDWTGSVTFRQCRIFPDFRLGFSDFSATFPSFYSHSAFICLHNVCKQIFINVNFSKYTNSTQIWYCSMCIVAFRLHSPFKALNMCCQNTRQNVWHCYYAF